MILYFQHGEWPWNLLRYMVQWMHKKVEGALGGSALQYFRITVDYRRGLAFFGKDIE